MYSNLKLEDVTSQKIGFWQFILQRTERPIRNVSKVRMFLSHFQSVVQSDQGTFFLIRWVQTEAENWGFALLSQ
jgi:hypothetical protein